MNEYISTLFEAKDVPRFCRCLCDFGSLQQKWLRCLRPMMDSPNQFRQPRFGRWLWAKLHWCKCNL